MAENHQSGPYPPPGNGDMPAGILIYWKFAAAFQMPLWIALILLTGLVAYLVLSPGWGALARWRRLRTRKSRNLIDDGLKHLFSQEQSGLPGTPDSLAGGLALGQRPATNLIARMEAQGLISSSGGGLHLTEGGKRRALQVVRAHRLWERYLADEARVPLEKVHRIAEKAEHGLSPERLDALEAHLGHPLSDPHGDPIPRSDGIYPAIAAVPLTDWKSDQPAEIVHVEDEPDYVFQRILAEGLRPGTPVRVLERRPDGWAVEAGDRTHLLAPVVAANIHVGPAREAALPPAGTIPLSQLADGATARVLTLDPQFRGFARRRLLDLGFTPETEVSVELSNAFGDPRGYRIRGTLVALRGEQAQYVWVRVPEAVGQE